MSNKFILLSVAFILALVMPSCSSSDDNNITSKLGEIKFSISGGIEANKEGIADFDKLDIMNTSTWELGGHDISPQTFSLNFSLLSANQSITRPQPGTYTIGFDVNNSDAFHAVYTHIEDGDFANSVEYTTWEQNSGTLTIDSSSEDKVTGSFNVTLYKYDDTLNIEDEIQLNGTFSANKRMY